MFYYIFLFCFIYGIFQGIKNLNDAKQQVVKENEYSGLLDFIIHSNRQ